MKRLILAMFVCLAVGGAPAADAPKPSEGEPEVATNLRGEPITTGDTVVYHPKGSTNVHIKGCGNMTDNPKAIATMPKMTLSETQRQGLSLCPLCPGNPKATTNLRGQPIPVADTVVYHPPGTQRVHVKECGRLTKDPKALAEMEKMTLAEAAAKGWPPCSRCPGSTTPGKGNPTPLPKSWVNPPRDEVLRKAFTPSERAPLVSLGADGRLVYKPFSDRGDRIIDFSTAGYMKNEVPVPTLPVVKTLVPPKGEAVPAIKMAYPVGPDSFDRIQSALEEVASTKADENGFKGTVLLKKGTWYVSRGLLVKSGVVLRGEGDGEDGTVLLFTGLSGGTGIQIGSGAGGSTVQTVTQLSGKLTRETVDGEDAYFLALDNGIRKSLSIPGFEHDYKMDDFVGDRVTVDLPLLTTSQGREQWKSLKHNMPYKIVRLAEGEAASPVEPGLNLEESVGKREEPETRITDSYVPTGARTITVEDAGRFRVGDPVDVLKTTNDQWIEALGVGERLRHIRAGKEGAGKRAWQPTNYSHLRTITAIEGNTLTLDVNLPQSIAAEYGGGAVRKADRNSDTQCGVEFIRLVSNYDNTQSSGSKSADYGNLKNGIGISAADGWVRDCTVLHAWFAAVNMDGSRQCTVRDCKSLKPVGPVRGGKRYAFSISGSTGMLVYRCVSEDGRHDFVIGSRTMGPNAFLKCTVPEGGNGEPHHRWGVGTLWDNVSMPDGGALCSFNRGDSGSGHGWAGANSVFWNCNAASIVVFNPETEGENNFAIGFTGSTDGSDGKGTLKYANTRAGYWGTPREGIYYGYALMGSGYIESPDKPVKPHSLFKQQLIDRIGKARAEAVLR